MSYLSNRIFDSIFRGNQFSMNLSTCQLGLLDNSGIEISGGSYHRADINFALYSNPQDNPTWQYELQLRNINEVTLESSGDTWQAARFLGIFEYDSQVLVASKEDYASSPIVVSPSYRISLPPDKIILILFSKQTPA